MRLKSRRDGCLQFLHPLIPLCTFSAIGLREGRNRHFGLDQGVGRVALASTVIVVLVSSLPLLIWALIDVPFSWSDDGAYDNCVTHDELATTVAGSLGGD